MSKHISLRWSVFLVLALDLAACLSAAAPPLSPTATSVPSASPIPLATLESVVVNIARAARLSQTIAIEVAPVQPRVGFTSTVLIKNKAIIDRFVGMLDQEKSVGPRLACVPELELSFQLEDGTSAKFEYMCGDGSPYFLEGSSSNQSFAFDGVVGLSDRFKDLLDEQLLLASQPAKIP